jgi:hypothetical protein
VSTHRQEDVIVSVRLYGLASTLGLVIGFSQPGLAGEPARLGIPANTPLITPASGNQKLADTIAAQLRSSGQLRHYTVDIRVAGSSVEVSGSVTDQSQREEVLRLVQGVPGVERVLDHLSVGNATTSPLTTVQNTTPPGRLPEPLPGATRNERPPATSNGTAPSEPTPLFRAPAPSYYTMNPPHMPPYAWPTYAPYNNFSRVAVPTAYPYNAWPFIGPIYPFPKVPLGWRSVKLEWDDGHWWYRRTWNQHDAWRLRYW